MCLYTIGNIQVALASDSSFNTSLPMHTATKGKLIENTVVLKILLILKEIEMKKYYWKRWKWLKATTKMEDMVLLKILLKELIMKSVFDIS